MSTEIDAQQNIKKDFDIWEKKFEQKLKQDRPFDLTDQNIADLLQEMRKTFESSQQPVRYKFDKVILALVSEIVNHCVMDVDDFPELTIEESLVLSRAAKEVAEEVMVERESEQSDELAMVHGKDLADTIKTVLNYEGEGPEPIVPNPEQLKRWEAGRFSDK